MATGHKPEQPPTDTVVMLAIHALVNALVEIHNRVSQLEDMADGMNLGAEPTAAYIQQAADRLEDLR